MLFYRQNVQMVYFGTTLKIMTCIFVLDVLHQIGFYGVYRGGRLVYDCHLITALVERWRPETHTFHFRVGEATITLEDVQNIWALPIDGEPVTGLDIERSTEEWQIYCREYLEFSPDEEAFKGSRLHAHAIMNFIKTVEITHDTPRPTVLQYTRCMAMLLLGGLMYPDSSENLVRLLYLSKLEEINAARNYSWGSAGNYVMPVSKAKRQLVVHCNCYSLSGNHMTWNSNRIMAYAADFTRKLWRSACPLIFYAIVEIHHPERVLRQFGMRQNILKMPDSRDMTLHQISSKARTGTDWDVQHILHISR
ncbi:UNVERIFIED_CONTAM: Serine/threonine-protein phosphatase 7 long form [Sesamum radiatum]|uniref:Serine/threonine-protein phosphatase 7 long form n=1 Tax=Sesamum radiatum TaxID=300843 RepID=A0AAW2PLW8_SESRA